MTYRLSCGDVMPGCPVTFSEADDVTLMSRLAEHAASAHGITVITPELRATVATKVRVGD